jgi:hypothetical protein
VLEEDLECCCFLVQKVSCALLANFLDVEIIRSKERKQKREREEGTTSKKGKNPLRNSSRTRRSPNRSEEEYQSKEMDK